VYPDPNAVEARDAVVIATACFTVIEHGRFAEVETESASPTPNETAPDCVGVPVIEPDRASRVRPGGSRPEMDHVYGGWPPDPVKIDE